MIDLSDGDISVTTSACIATIPGIVTRIYTNIYISEQYARNVHQRAQSIFKFYGTS